MKKILLSIIIFSTLSFSAFADFWPPNNWFRDTAKEYRQHLIDAIAKNELTPFPELANYDEIRSGLESHFSKYVNIVKEEIFDQNGETKTIETFALTDSGKQYFQNAARINILCKDESGNIVGKYTLNNSDSKYKQYAETTSKELMDKISLSAKEELSYIQTLGGVADDILDCFAISLIKSYDKISGSKHTNGDNQTSLSESKVGRFNLQSISGIILMSLLVIEIMIMGIFFALKQKGDIAEVIVKILETIVLALLLTNMLDIITLSQKVFNWGAKNAANYTEERIQSYNDDSEMLRPSDVSSLMDKVLNDISLAKSYMLNTFEADDPGWDLGKIISNAFDRILLSIVFGIITISVIIIFGICMFYILIWQIELRVLLVMAAFLLPFRIFRYTNFMAKGIWPVLLGQCIKIFTATFVINFFSKISGTIFESLHDSLLVRGFSRSATLWAYVPGIILISVVFAYFLLRAPDMTRSFIVGQPTTDSNGLRMMMKAGSVGLGASAFATKKGSKLLGKGLDKSAAGIYGLTKALKKDPADRVNDYNAYKAEALRNKDKEHSSFASFAARKISNALSNRIRNRGTYNSTAKMQKEIKKAQKKFKV